MMTSTDLWPILSVVLSIVTAIISALVGFIVKGLVQEMRDLRTVTATTNTVVADLQRIVAGDYITRRESQDQYDKLDVRLREVDRR
jgi:hypothetical protein